MTRQNDYIQEINKSIGNKIYALRLAKNLTKQHLAEYIGVSQQQLQKYEQGTNRISVGRLILIAEKLEKNVYYFYEGLDSDCELKVTKHQLMCMEVSENFMKIRSLEQQNAMHILIKSLAAKE